VFKKESHALGSRSLMVSQATYRIMGDRRKYKKELHKYHTVHSFYSITEFLGVELTKGMCKDNNFYYN